MSKNISYINIVSDFKNRPFFSTVSDRDYGAIATRQILERDDLYTSLLKTHVTITKLRNWAKEIHKWVFFWIIIVAGFFALKFMYYIMKPLIETKDVNMILEAIPIIITSIVAFISTVIVVPTTITRFLFNTQEDDNITKLIAHTQDHDSTWKDFLSDRFSDHKDVNTPHTEVERSPDISANSNSSQETVGDSFQEIVND